MLSDITLLPWLEALSHYPGVRSFTTYVADHYCVVATFEHSQKVLVLNSKPRATYVPFDWLQANPRITILERKGLQRLCERPAPTTAQAATTVLGA